MIRKNPRWRWRPSRVSGLGHAFVFAQVDAVKQAWIIAFPPFSIAVGQRQISVVRNAFLVAFSVAPERRLPPPPGVFMMKRDAKMHAVRATGLGPFANQIALRPEVDGIPRLVMRV